MSKLLLKNIKTLVQVREANCMKVSGLDMKELPCISNAWLAIDEGWIADYGTMTDFPGIEDWKDLEIVDCEGKLVLPCYADSHTHLVHAGSREEEFVNRINRLSYEAIAKRGGGIWSSVKSVRATTENDLFEQAMVRLKEVISQGTGSIEIKSGYGLSVEDELKMLRVIKRIKDLNLMPVKATFLGAHALPLEFKHHKEGYIHLIVKEMLPNIAAEKLADFMDVFCEQNYFTPEETEYLLKAGKEYGLTPKVHAEQMSHFGGIQAGVACGAISVDHLEYCNDTDIEILKQSNTMATILPGAAFFLGLPLPPARKMIDAGLAVAMASDFNPGSCPSGNMNFMMSLGCIQYQLTPEEVINACTINSAYAMQTSHETGSITIGKRANFFITKPINSYSVIPYAFASSMIDCVYLNGVKQ